MPQSYKSTLLSWTRVTRLDLEVDDASGLNEMSMEHVFHYFEFISLLTKKKQKHRKKTEHKQQKTGYKTQEHKNKKT